jgi:predicted nucleic acid-binding protein
VTYGITLDTGALIAYERGASAMRRRLMGAWQTGVVVTVPAVVLIEWWRSGFGRRHRELIAPMRIEPTTQHIAKAAGEALTNDTSASVVDAAVMASAALRGDVVFTSDLGDLGRLQTHFPTVRLFGV